MVHTGWYWALAAVVGILSLAKQGTTMLGGGATSDLAAYTAAAAHLRAGQPLYWLPIVQGSTPPSYLYPPFLALVFTLLGPAELAWWLWSLFSLGCWIGAAAIVIHELRVDLNKRLGARGWPLLLAGLAAFPPLSAHLIWGQVGLPILLCLVGAWLMLRRGREWPAGALMGVAIALKLYPALALLPLLARGRWRAGLACGLVAGLLIGGGFLFISWEQTRFYLLEVIPAAGGHAVNDPGNYALRERLGGPLFALAALGVLVVLALAGRRGDPAEAFALAVTAMLLLSPVVWGHYFVIAVLPWLHALARCSRPQLVALVVAGLLIATAATVFTVPPSLVPLAQLTPLVGTLLLFGVQLQQTLGRPAAQAEPSRSLPA